MTASKSRRRAAPRRRPQLEPFKPARFIAAHPVFRFEEFVEAHSEAKPKAIEDILRYHVKHGDLCLVRRGVYARESANSWLLASRLATDAVIAYDGALSFHGIEAVDSRITFMSDKRPPLTRFSDTVFQAVIPPKAVRRLPDWGGEITTEYREGLKLRVTTPERTLVDMLDRLDLAHSARRLWDTFRLVDLRPLRMIEYAHKLGSRLVAARLGYLLEQLGATQEQLRLLEKLRPKAPCYFDKRHRDHRDAYFRRWNLVVPFKLWSYVRDAGPPPQNPLERVIRDFERPELRDDDDSDG